MQRPAKHTDWRLRQTVTDAVSDASAIRQLSARDSRPGFEAPPVPRRGLMGICLLLAILMAPGSWWFGRVWGEHSWLYHAMPSSQIEPGFRAMHFSEGAIQSGPPDDRYVCHDWTFFDGRRSDDEDCDIEKHLRNHFEPANQPRVGDVIVYRQPATGEIVHSGLVKAIGERGFVLIESKWGDRGRYLHLPELTGFSSHYSYYRRVDSSLLDPSERRAR